MVMSFEQVVGVMPVMCICILVGIGVWGEYIHRRNANYIEGKVEKR